MYMLAQDYVQGEKLMLEVWHLDIALTIDSPLASAGIRMRLSSCFRQALKLLHDLKSFDCQSLIEGCRISHLSRGCLTAPCG